MSHSMSPVSNVSTTVVDLGAALDHHPTSSSIPHHLQDETNNSTPSSSDTSPPRKESTFETADGTLHVTPFRKKGSKRLKAIVTFVPRASTFDRENPQSGSDQFRGFFTLFWISMFLLTVRTYWDSFESSGYPISLNFATLLSKDAKGLLLSDGVLVFSTGVVVPFMKLVKNGWVRYYWTGVAIQHVYQAALLGAAIAWTFNRQWPWVQSGFFTLHTLVMLMKVHSYCAVNGYLATQSFKYDSTLRKIKSLCSSDSSIGSYDKAVEVATAQRESGLRARRKAEMLSESSGSNDTTPALTPSLSFATISPPNGVNGAKPGYPFAPTNSSSLSTAPNINTAGLRQRLHALQTSTPALQPPTRVDPSSQSQPPPSAVEDEFAPNRHILCHHPSPEISELAQTLTELDQELVSSEVQGNREGMRWPENLTLWNFMDYMLIPTLVYEMQYPRTATIRPLYILEKTAATFGTFTLLYTYTEHYIIPHTPNGDQPFLRSMIDLVLPFMICYLLLFYIIFECICNGFAELSFFADRQFYEDWWNSTTWDEYARKWNKPVHTFLLRHVYAATRSSLRFSKTSAAFATFFLSALAHELVMAVVTQKIRLYLFLMQMIQIPLIAMGRMPVVQRNKNIGNIVFWFGLLTGFPLLCVAYCAH